MFENFKKDESMINHYIEVRNIDKNNIIYSKYQLGKEKNIKEYINNLFNKAQSKSTIIITDAVVYEEDAYINTALFALNKQHVRIYTVNEILDITKNYARLNYFLQFKETMDIKNINNSSLESFIRLINNMPEHIKAELNVKYDENKPAGCDINSGIFIFTKI